MSSQIDFDLHACVGLQKSHWPCNSSNPTLIDFNLRNIYASYFAP